MPENTEDQKGIESIAAYFEMKPGPTGIVFVALENIAEDLDDDLLSKIGRNVVEGYNTDKDSMQDWVDGVELGLELVKQEKSARSEPWENAANFKSPTLMSAALKFSDRASTELLRGRDIVKTTVIGKDDEGQKAERADRVAEFQNYQINVEMPEWREEQDKLLYDLPYIGTQFKKTFFNPRLGRNVSNLVSYPNFVVSNTADSLTRLPRFSEDFELRHNEVLERQSQGLWLDISVEGFTTDEEKSDTEAESDKIQAFIEQQGVYDIDGDGYAEPYVFTVHLATQRVMRIIPRFEPKDVLIKNGDKASRLDILMQDGAVSGEIMRIKPDNNITKYGFLRDPQGGFLDVGYGHLLGALTSGINASTNQLIDAGTLSNVQGGWLAKGFRKRMGNAKIQAGVFQQTGLSAQDLQSGVFPYPIKEPSSVLFALMQMMVTSSQELSASADLTSALGANAPATTTLALIQEQQLSAGAVILRIYRSMSEEFSKLFVLNSKFLDPEEYQMVLDDPEADFAQDFNLRDMDIVPTANPEVSSKIQRIQLAQAELSNLEAVMAAGGDIRPIVKGFFDAIGSSNVEQIFPEEEPMQILQRLLAENPDLAELISQEQERNQILLEAQIEGQEREQARLDLELSIKADDQERKNAETRADNVLTLEKAETEDIKNDVDVFNTFIKPPQSEETNRSQ
jgi:chaperonin GroES